jgi:hypothetical protein
MTKRELRAEALRAAVAIELRQIETSHTHTFDFAELYFDFLCFGRVPKQVGRPTPENSPSSRRTPPDQDHPDPHLPK